MGEGTDLKLRTERRGGEGKGSGKAPAAQRCEKKGAGEALGPPALSLHLAFGPPQPPGFEPGTPAAKLPSPCLPAPTINSTTAFLHGSEGTNSRRR